MNVLIVFAHPEPRSLDASLCEVAVKELQEQGHEVQVSNLYAMRWKTQRDQADFLAGMSTPDIGDERHKLLWADALILQFPLWCFGMPAILKDWIDRVFADGGGLRQGCSAGKRAMLVVTAGAPEEHFSAHSVNGSIEDILFPINHGVLLYPGYDVLPPFVVYRSDDLGSAAFEAAAERLRDRVCDLAESAHFPSYSLHQLSMATP